MFSLQDISMLMQVKKLIEAKDFKSAANAAENALRNDPDNTELLLLAAQAQKELGDYNSSERNCLAGMAVSAQPDFYDIFARISVSRNNLREAAGRWRLFRAKFPRSATGYEEGLKIAISMKDWAQAGEICKESLKGSRLDFSCISLPEEAKATLLAWVREPGKIRHYQEMLRRMTVYMRFWPDDKEAWLEKARIYMAQSRPGKAEQICVEALETWPDDEQFLELLAEAGSLQNKNVRKYWFRLIALHGNARIIEKAIHTLLKQDDWQGAWAIYSGHQENITDESLKTRLKLAIRLIAEPQNQAQTLAACMEEYGRIVNPGAPITRDTRLYLNMLAKSQDPGVRRRHHSCIETLFSSINLKEPALPDGKFCVYTYAESLAYIREIIKNIPPDEVDIIIKFNNYHPSLLAGLGLENYRIVDASQLSSYKKIFADYCCRPEYVKGQVVLAYFHSADGAGAFMPGEVAGYIVVNKAAAIQDGIELIDDEYRWLSCIGTGHKTEMAYTGPFNVGRPETEDRADLKAQLEARMGIELDPDKPLVYFPEVDYHPLPLLYRAARKISEFANVIYKPYYPPSLKASGTLFLCNDKAYSNNLLRFAADYILASFLSGTLTSSLMLGLSVIPYYTRAMIRGPKYKPQRFQAFLPYEPILPHDRYSNRHFMDSCRSYMHANGLLVDLLDTERIRRIISGKDENPIAGHHSDFIRKEIFGDFTPWEAAPKTAALIRRFFQTGTFGPDCSSVVLNM